LLARVKAVLRRTQQVSQGAQAVIRVGDLLVDRGRYEARLGTAPVELTTLEFEMLATLAENRELVMTREQLLQQVWGYEYLGDHRVVDAVIKRLRAKLRDAGSSGDLIVTVRGVGYKLEP